MADSDCTWISHSVLQPRLEHSPDEEENVSGEEFWTESKIKMISEGGTSSWQWAESYS